jgi:hypothetical protein
MKKVLLFCIAAAVIMVVGIFLIWFNMFPEVYHFRNLTLHYQHKDSADTSEVVLAFRKLELSAVFDSMKSYNIYLCPNAISFNVFAPFSPGSVSNNYITMKAVFLRPLKNFVEKNSEIPRRINTMAGTIATSITLMGLDDNLGVMHVERWKKVGYAEYIGGDSLFSIQSLFKNDTIEPRLIPLIESIKDQFVLTYLLREQGIRFDSLLTLQINRDSILKECFRNGISQ